MSPALQKSRAHFMRNAVSSIGSFLSRQHESLNHVVEPISTHTSSRCFQTVAKLGYGFVVNSPINCLSFTDQTRIFPVKSPAITRSLL